MRTHPAQTLPEASTVPAIMGTEELALLGLAQKLTSVWRVLQIAMFMQLARTHQEALIAHVTPGSQVPAQPALILMNAQPKRTIVHHWPLVPIQ